MEGLEGFISFQYTRSHCNEISSSYFTMLKWAAKILVEVLLTGTLQWHVYNGGSVFGVGAYFEGVTDSFADSLNLSPETETPQDQNTQVPELHGVKG